MAASSGQTHQNRVIARFAPSAIQRPLLRPAPAVLRHSVPPGVHLPATRLSYAGTIRACCTRGLLSSNLSGNLSGCPAGFSLSPSPNLCFPSGRPIFHRLANSAATSPLQNGEGPGVRFLSRGGRGVRLGCPAICPIVQPVSPSVRVQIFNFCLVVQSFTGSLIELQPPLSRMERGRG